MDSVSFRGIDLLLVASDAAGKCWQRWMPVPPSVDERGLARYVEQMFGPPFDPVDPAAEYPGPGGWLLDATAVELDGLPPSADRLQVLPHVRLESGERQPLPEYRSVLSSRFAALVGTPVPVEAPTEGGRRLDSEQLTLIEEDERLIELQLTGWLQRMIDEGGTYLTICLGERGRYVQFMVDGDRRQLVAEAVSNRHLEPYQALSRSEQEALITAGWNAPDGAAADNYWSHWSLPGPSPMPHPSQSATMGPPSRRHSLSPQAMAAARLAAYTICVVFAADRAHRAAVDVGQVGADAY